MQCRKGQTLPGSTGSAHGREVQVTEGPTLCTLMAVMSHMPTHPELHSLKIRHKIWWEGTPKSLLSVAAKMVRKRSLCGETHLE